MYRTYTEYTEELLTFLDMCLFSATDAKRRGKRLLTGVVAYEVAEGAKEEEDGYDYACMARELWDAIRERESMTREHGGSGILWFDTFCRRFGFDEWQRFLLLVCTGSHLDREFERVYACIQDDPDAVWPTLGLAWPLYQYIFFGNTRVLQYPGQMLPEGFLLENAWEGQLVSGWSFPLRLNKAVLRYLGLLPQGECGYLKKYCPSGGIMVYEGKARYIQQLLACQKDSLGCWRTQEKSFLFLYGESGTGRHAVLKTACDRAGIRVYFLCADSLPEAYGDVLLEASMAARLEGALLCIECCGKQDGEQGRQSKILQRLSELLGYFAVLADSLEQQTVINGAVRIDVEIPVPDGKQRFQLWEHFLAKNGLMPDTDIRMELLAGNYVLTAEKIKQITAYLAADKAAVTGKKHLAAGKIQMGDIRRAVSFFAPNLLGESAVRINAGYTWDDIVLDEAAKRMLRHICDRYRLRDIVENEKGLVRKSLYGNGISAVFHGAPGTGKTMAVQVVANELGLDVYKVDISKLVSKYVGETEKNISGLFGKAKRTNSILFFDEADSLFARRTEVRSVYDRNANMESAHLLQEMEEYNGIVVLATNLVENIDAAFMRRIKYSIQFYPPDRDMRRLLWQKMAGPGMVAEEGLDLDYYADLMKITGSDIKEIYTSAAYIAAAEDRPLGDAHIREAADMHCAKLGGVRLLSD